MAAKILLKLSCISGAVVLLLQEQTKNEDVFEVQILRTQTTLLTVNLLVKLTHLIQCRPDPGILRPAGHFRAL